MYIVHRAIAAIAEQPELLIYTLQTTKLNDFVSSGSLTVVYAFSHVGDMSSRWSSG